MRIAPFVAGLATAFVLAACAGEPPPQSPADEAIHAGFPAGRTVDEIEIDAVDRLPLRSAELIAPDGAATPADRLQVTASPTASYTQRLGNDPYAGNVFGIANLGLAPPEAAAAPQSRTATLTMAATAWITLPDRVAYQRDWRGYHLRLRFGDPPGAVETRILAAPAPPE
jgi:hypothetical protein